jgi:hypothetical protein
MLATPESVDSSSASPESGVLAADVLVLDPSLGNENSPGGGGEIYIYIYIYIHTYKVAAIQNCFG